MRRALPLIREVLNGVAADGDQVVIVSDENGRLLWIGGDPLARMRAMDEMGAGEAVDARTCAAAPVCDPAGQVVGVISLTGRDESVHPHDLAVVAAAARAAEAHLRLDQHERDAELRERHLEGFLRLPARQRALVGPGGRVLLAEPREWISTIVAIPDGGGPLTLPGGVSAVAEPAGSAGAFLLRGERAPKRPPPTLTLAALGRDRALASFDGRELELSQRRSDLLVLLAGRPEGATAEELALAVYGDSGKPATVRGELFRLRGILGPWLRAEPYRLEADIDADFLAVRNLLRAGRVLEAAQRYPAPLLPRSQAPGVIEARNELDDWLRRAVMSAGDRETLWAWLQGASGRDDALAWKRFVAGLDYGDARRSEATARLALLRDSFERSG